MRRQVAFVLLAVFAAQFVVFGALEAWRDSLTDDEGIYLAAGVTALARHDLRISPEAPPLPKLAAAAPALLAHPIVPRGASWRSGDTNQYAADFITAQRRSGRLHRVVFLSRLAAMVETVVCGVLIYVLGAALFSRAAGVAAAGLWLTAPFVVGLGHLNSQDVAFTFAVLAVSVALLRLLRRPSHARLVVLAVVCGGALLTRSYALLLVPTVAVTVVCGLWARGPRSALGRGAVLLLVAWASVWVGVLAVAPSRPPREATRRAATLVADARSSSRAARVALAVPWPAEYRAGIAYLQVAHRRPARTYLLGQVWTGTRWWYFPVSAAVKFPATTLLALAAGVFGWRAVDDERRRLGVLALAIPAVVLGAFLSRQPTQIGLRYVLPVLALVVAATCSIVLVGRRAGAVAAALAIGVQTVCLWSSYPTTLAWTAPPFRPGYRVTADSNLDWGQDLGRLRAWARARTPDPYIAYVGPRGVGAEALPGTRLLSSVPPEQLRGWVAVSVRILVVYDREKLSWLRAYCPVDTVGGSILVYRFTETPDTAPGPGVPRRPCSGASSVRR